MCSKNSQFCFLWKHNPRRKPFQNQARELRLLRVFDNFGTFFQSLKFLSTEDRSRFDNRNRRSSRETANFVDPNFFFLIKTVIIFKMEKKIVFWRLFRNQKFGVLNGNLHFSRIRCREILNSSSEKSRPNSEKHREEPVFELDFETLLPRDRVFGGDTFWAFYEQKKQKPRRHTNIGA